MYHDNCDLTSVGSLYMPPLNKPTCWAR